MVIRRVILVLLVVLLLCLWPTAVLAEEDGWVNLVLDLPAGEFDNSVMINLIRSSGENYLLIAEPVNEWEIDSTGVPVGIYTVDFISIYGGSGNYTARGPEILQIGAGGGTELRLVVEEQMGPARVAETLLDAGVSGAVAAEEEQKGVGLIRYAGSLFLFGVVGSVWLWLKLKREREE